MGAGIVRPTVKYAQQLIVNPQDTILVLVSDLMEGLSEQSLIRTAASVKASGVQLISLLALSDKGKPVYDRNMASNFQALDIPVFGCTPDLFPSLMAAAINRNNIQQWMARHNIG